MAAPLLKAHVKGHTRKLASGKVVSVRPHEDKRAAAQGDLFSGFDAAGRAEHKDHAPAAPADKPGKNRVLSYHEAVAANMSHMGSSLDEWRAVGITGMGEVDAGDGKTEVVPEFDFPSGYENAPALYTGQCCNLCGTNIKRVFWIQNDRRKWVMPVGSECVGRFGDGDSGDRLAKKTVWEKNRAALREASKAKSMLWHRFSVRVSHGYGRYETGMFPRSATEHQARKTWEELRKLLGSLKPDSAGDAAITSWARKNGVRAAELVATARQLIAQTEVPDFGRSDLGLRPSMQDEVRGSGASVEEYAQARRDGLSHAEAIARFRERRNAASKVVPPARQHPTETPEFKRWFGGSKAVDADGKPLVVYHGTGRDTSAFTYKVGRERTLGRYYFASDSRTADEYAGKGDGANTMPVYLAIKNPLEVDYEGGQWASFPLAKLPPEIAAIIPEKNILRGKGDSAWVSNSAIATAAESLGYDGLITRNVKDGAGPHGEQTPGDVFLVFRPEQIKSAIGNNGQFDPANPDITKSLRTPILFVKAIHAPVGGEHGADGKWYAGGQFMPALAALLPRKVHDLATKLLLNPENRFVVDKVDRSETYRRWREEFRGREASAPAYRKLQALLRDKFTVREKDELETIIDALLARIARGDYGETMAKADMPAAGERLEFAGDRYTDKGPATGEVLEVKATVDGYYLKVKFPDGEETLSWDDMRAGATRTKGGWLLKAEQLSLLFDMPVTVSGYVTKQGKVVRAHAAKRKHAVHPARAEAEAHGHAEAAANPTSGRKDESPAVVDSPVSKETGETKVENANSIQRFIVRSSTGVYHLSYQQSGGAVRCNSRNGGIATRLAKESDVLRAKDSSFCGKCFPNGKPADLSKYFPPSRADWEDAVYTAIEERAEVTRSDAQGIAEAKQDLMDAAFAAGKSPADVAGEILGAASAPAVDLASFIKVAADDIASLRKQDVDRVLSEAPAEHRQAVADYIVANRADLAEEVAECMAELEPAAPATPAKRPRTIADVTAALRAEGLPVELVKGDGYLYFVCDDPARNIFEDKSIMVAYFNRQTPEQWIADGREFAASVRAKIEERSATAESASPKLKAKVTEEKPEAEPAAEPATLKFDGVTCSRCGGSGNYSFNLMHGSKCYGCGGTGRKLTKRGHAALEFWNNLRTRKVSDLKVGDLIQFDMFSYKVFARIESIEPDPLNPGVIIISGTRKKTGERMGFGTYPNATVTAGFTAEEKADMIRRTVEYQNSLTADGKPRKVARRESA